MAIAKKINFRALIESIILFVISVFALVFLLSFLKIGGLRMYAVKSGSMAPEIKIGSVVFTNPAGSYQVGDVITYSISNGRDYVTHRVVKVGGEGDNTVYITKGDANAGVDTDKVPKSRIVGKVNYHVSYLGYFVQYVKTLPGLIILIIIPATIIIYEEIRKIRAEAKKIIKKRRTKKARERG